MKGIRVSLSVLITLCIIFFATGCSGEEEANGVLGNSAMEIAQNYLRKQYSSSQIFSSEVSEEKISDFNKNVQEAGGGENFMVVPNVTDASLQRNDLADDETQLGVVIYSSSEKNKQNAAGYIVVKTVPLEEEIKFYITDLYMSGSSSADSEE